MPRASCPGGQLLATAVLLALATAAFAQGPPDAPLPPPPYPLPRDPAPSLATQPAPDAPKAPAADGPLLSPFTAAPWASPSVGHVPYVAAFRVTWLPDESVSGQATKLGLVQNDASVRFPLWQTDCDELSGSLHARVAFIQTGAILPDTDQPFPDQLWDLRAGVGYRHLFDNGWIAGANVSVGSASNEPFHSINEMTVGVNAFLRVPQGEHNAWLFSLNYSPTGELSFPIPGAAFAWAPSEAFHMNIGLPFMIHYRPVEDLTLEASYMLLTTMHARATYRVCKSLRVYTGFDWSSESWYVVPRPDVKDRLFYYEKRLSVGAATNLGRAFLLDVSTGYVFDRSYFEGHNSNDRSFNRVDVGSAPLLSVQAQVRW
jgi:hypothetical protein